MQDVCAAPAGASPRTVPQLGTGPGAGLSTGGGEPTSITAAPCLQHTPTASAGFGVSVVMCAQKGLFHAKIWLLFVICWLSPLLACF